MSWRFWILTAVLLSTSGCGLFGGRESREASGSSGSPIANASYEQTLQSWVDASEQDLVASWGVPDRSQRLTNGAQALEYRRLDGDGKLLCSTLFTADASGKIQGWSYRGSNCRPPRLGDYGKS
ncbi:MAG TPA: hypothetical protein VGU20_16660 [Stellaceae bacterium]|nr:hypothetical protein [Stellaceae bacterium]